MMIWLPPFKFQNSYSFVEGQESIKRALELIHDEVYRHIQPITFDHLLDNVPTKEDGDLEAVL